MEYVSLGFSCDGCKMKPIKGVRYSCLQCGGYDLCAKCMDQEKHSHHLLIGVRNAKEGAALREHQQDPITKKWKALLPDNVRVEEYVHEGVSCDGCKAVPIKGIRYNCMQCVNFDLCSSCMDKGKHSHHLSIGLRNGKQADALKKHKMDPITKKFKALIKKQLKVGEEETGEEEEAEAGPVDEQDLDKEEEEEPVAKPVTDPAYRQSTMSNSRDDSSSSSSSSSDYSYDDDSDS